MPARMLAAASTRSRLVLALPRACSRRAARPRAEPAGRGRRAGDPDPVAPTRPTSSTDRQPVAAAACPGSDVGLRVAGDADPETITVTVTDETRRSQGVTTTVVATSSTDAGRQVVEDDRRLVTPRTATATSGTSARTTSTTSGPPDAAGSWEAGVDGAQAGLAMPAEPGSATATGRSTPGVAEDQADGAVARRTAARRRRARTTTCSSTEDSTPLEPGVVERKFYAEGVGLVFEETVSGGTDQVELVVVHRAADASAGRADLGALVARPSSPGGQACWAAAAAGRRCWACWASHGRRSARRRPTAGRCELALLGLAAAAICCRRPLAARPSSRPRLRRCAAGSTAAGTGPGRRSPGTAAGGRAGRSAGRSRRPARRRGRTAAGRRGRRSRRRAAAPG